MKNVTAFIVKASVVKFIVVGLVVGAMVLGFFATREKVQPGHLVIALIVGAVYWLLGLAYYGVSDRVNWKKWSPDPDAQPVAPHLPNRAYFAEKDRRDEEQRRAAAAGAGRS